MNYKLKISLLLFIGLTFQVVSNAAESPLGSRLSKQILANTQVTASSNFDEFLTQLITRNLVDEEQTRIVRQFQNNETLQGHDLHLMQRLLGLYTRAKYGQQAMDTLAELVAIPTFRNEEVAQYDNPEFHKMADKVRHIAEDFNLAFRNIDDRVYEISLDGSGNEVVGIHAHADVVPVTPSLWVLDDGTKLDPFKLTLIGDRMYGRGTEDDKNGIVVTLYAMKVIKEENLPLLRNFKLLVDTTEESTGQAIPYYFKSNPTPNYNLALDGGYPVVIAEKGFGIVLANFAVRPAKQNDVANAEVVNITGGLAINQIPAASVATITSSSPIQLASRLNALGKVFVAEKGSDFSILATANSQGVELTVKGESAHSSEPQSGVNPVSRMFVFLDYVQSQQALFKPNHITDAANYVAANWGVNYLGQPLGIDYNHDFMGPLTNAVTLVKLDDDHLTVGVNLRIPVGRASDGLRKDILNKLSAWKAKDNIASDFTVTLRDPMYRNPEGKWVNALLDVATENLDMPRQFGASAGGTSVHNLPNGVQFGLAMPDQKYTGHNANEFKRVDQFLVDLQIVTEMIARIGQMPSLE
ncbi:dipeptidase [Alteromonas sp. C1M14]|uniref:dipeptidase n=1 Tax=Alteromonas sp. C1M14 TaxID=2841567 RepID=UPI001C07FD76|nr:dipeptidase [Alteromonas sp. C1M14]MBU2979460.1 dipeptidase [Alteromonas sp. C1M14]